jgi:hypothetical protein
MIARRLTLSRTQEVGARQLFFAFFASTDATSLVRPAGVAVLDKCHEYAAADNVSECRPEDEMAEIRGGDCPTNRPANIWTLPTMTCCRCAKPIAEVISQTIAIWLMVSRAAVTSQDNKPINQPANDALRKRTLAE